MNIEMKWKAVELTKKVGGCTHEIQFGDDGECISERVYGEANAKLIAAAPELLEVVKKLRSTMNILCGYRKVRKVIMESEGADKMLSDILEASSVVIKATE